MSVVVNYKDNKIAEIDDGSLTLRTKSKWMEDDIEIISSAHQPIWLPKSAELVASSTETINLSDDTSYDSWTPSTTNTSILAVGSTRGACKYVITANDYDTCLIGLCIFHTDIAYPNGTTMAKGYSKNKTVYGIAYYAPMETPDYESYPNFGMTFYSTTGKQIYYTSSTAKASYASTSYGIGITGISWSVSSTTSDSARTVGFTRPIIYARCHSTYFSTASASALDSSNTNIYCEYRIYKIPKSESMVYHMFDCNDGEFFK